MAEPMTDTEIRQMNYEIGLENEIKRLRGELKLTTDERDEARGGADQLRAALATVLHLLDSAVSDLAQAYPKTAQRYRDKAADWRAWLDQSAPADR